MSCNSEVCAEHAVDTHAASAHTHGRPPHTHEHEMVGPALAPTNPHVEYELGRTWLIIRDQFEHGQIHDTAHTVVQDASFDQCINTSVYTRAFRIAILLPIDIYIYIVLLYACHCVSMFFRATTPVVVRRRLAAEKTSREWQLLTLE